MDSNYDRNPCYRALIRPEMLVIPQTHYFDSGENPNILLHEYNAKLPIGVIPKLSLGRTSRQLKVVLQAGIIFWCGGGNNMAEGKRTRRSRSEVLQSKLEKLKEDQVKYTQKLQVINDQISLFIAGSSFGRGICPYPRKI